MTPAVVEQLEPVEVEEQDPDPGPPAGGPGQRHGQPVEEQHPVGEPGERIVEGVTEQRLLGAFAGGDVPHGHQQLLPVGQ